jgi:hypothetical protein
MFCLYTSSFPANHLNFTEGESNGIESRLPFNFFSTLHEACLHEMKLVLIASKKICT